MTIPDPLKCGPKTFARWCQREHARGCRFFLDLPGAVDRPRPAWVERDPIEFARTLRAAINLTHHIDFSVCILEPRERQEQSQTATEPSPV